MNFQIKIECYFLEYTSEERSAPVHEVSGSKCLPEMGIRISFSLKLFSLFYIPKWYLYIYTLEHIYTLTDADKGKTNDDTCRTTNSKRIKIRIPFQE